MSPILGIWASSIQPSKQGYYESIATTTVGAGGASSVTFSSIPSTYTHLQIRGFVKSTAGSGNIRVNFNSDNTLSNYAYHFVRGDGSTVNVLAASGGDSNTTLFVNEGIPGSNGIAAFVADILDYKNTNKYKTSRILSGWDNNGAGYILLNSSLWMNTNAITNITLNLAVNAAQYSSFALYGIKGA